MVRVGKATKYDGFGRISCVGEVAKLLNLEKDMDHVEFLTYNGEIIIRKVTKDYMGKSFEQEEISENIREYEKRYAENFDHEEELDPDEIEKILYEQYLRDQEARKALIGSKKK
jgi:hypothetical protein